MLVTVIVLDCSMLFTISSPLMFVSGMDQKYKTAQLKTPTSTFNKIYIVITLALSVKTEH